MLRVREPVFSQQQADQTARAILKRRAEGFVGGRGESIGIPEIKPNANVTLQGLGDLFSTTFYVQQATHTVDSLGLSHDVRSEGHDDMSESLADMLLEARVGAGEPGIVRGVSVAIVAQNKDPEGLGRVKVRFPWRENPDESHWARIAVPMAGNGRGIWFLPEVDDEVLVAFDAERVEHPYVIGCLWNGQDLPPERNADGRNDLRVIHSRSGHRSCSTTARRAASTST